MLGIMKSALKMRTSLRLACLMAVAAGCAIAASAQVAGPMTPPPKYESHKVDVTAPIKAPPIPADEIIKKFTANEDVMKKAYDTFSFKQIIRVQETDDPDATFVVSGEMYMKSDGERYERIVKAPVSSLKRTEFTLEDVKTIASLPVFILTTDELANYNLKYEGTQKLDELDTYIFRVTPKGVSRTKRFFDGVVWVDTRDFVIVKNSGKFVREVEPSGTALPFTMFDTYRENIAGKYWFPTYTSSEDSLALPGNQMLALKLVIRSTDFQPNPIEVTGNARASTPGGAAPNAPKASTSSTPSSNPPGNTPPASAPK
jgi:hypothetical protein